jgi:periplasmic protein TonB
MHMIARYAVSIGVGAGVTFALLFIMQLLIATGRGAITEATNVRILDFVRVERENRVETKQQKPQKPPEPEKAPDIPSPDASTDLSGNAIAVSMSAPTISAQMGNVGVGFGVSDGEYLPIVKVAPIYPARAASRGLEGYVIVEFTVTRTGTVKDVTVVESSNSIFERAAVDAAYKFKYKPRVIDGEPVEVPGVRNKITFVLEK